MLAIGDVAHTPTPQLASCATIAIEDSIVLAQLIQSSPSRAEVLKRFMERWYERCRIVVENSWQLSEWEKTPNTPGADPTALMAKSMEALAAPI